MKSIHVKYLLPLSLSSLLFRLACITLCALPLNSCKKDKPCTDNGLPCLTTEGKNTFGCLIDGVPFVAEVKFTVGGAVAVSGSYDENSKLLQIQGKKDGSNDELERINFQSYITAGQSTYEMYVLIEDYVGYTDYTGPKCQYFHDINNKGKVTVLFLDEEKNIISGTFSMTLINPDCTSKSTMVITNGRFDFGY